MQIKSYGDNIEENIYTIFTNYINYIIIIMCCQSTFNK